MLAVEAAVGVEDGVGLLLLFVVVVVLVAHAGVLGGGDPGLAVVKRGVLAGQVEALGAGLDVVAAAGGQGAGARGQLRVHGRVRRHPVSQCVFAVLNDGLAGLVAVVRGAGLAGRHGRVVD